jgi:hypothetical protein
MDRWQDRWLGRWIPRWASSPGFPGIMPGLPSSLVSFVVARSQGVFTLRGPQLEYDYVDYTYANGEVAYGDPDGVELWVDPTEQYIDENNYSTYDSTTGVGRIVSDGAYVALYISNGWRIGDPHTIVCNFIEKEGDIKYQDKLVEGGQTTAAVGSSITIARYGACDVTFKLSVQKLEVAPPVDTETRTLREEYTSLTTEAVADLTNSFPLGITLATTSIIEDGSESKHETRIPMNLDTTSNYTLQFKVRRLVGTRNLKVAWVPSGAGFTSISNTFYDLGTGAKITGSDKCPDQLERKGDYWLFKPSSISTGDSANTNVYLALVDGTIELYQGDGASSIEVIDIMVVKSSTQLPYIPPGSTSPAITVEKSKGVYVGLVFQNIFNGVLSIEPPLGSVGEYIISSDNRLVRGSVAGLTSGDPHCFSARVRKAGANPATHTRLTINDQVSWASSESAKFTLSEEWQDLHLQFNGYASAGTYLMVGANAENAVVDPDCYGGIEIQAMQITVGAYQFPVIPPGATQPDCTGTSGGNGLQIEMSGERPDGVELWDDGAATPSNSEWVKGGGFWERVSDGSGEFSISGALTEGSRYECVVELPNYEGDSVRVQLGGPPITENRGNLTSAGTHTFTLPAESTNVLNNIRIGNGAVGQKVIVHSIQKLEPYISELKECYQGKPDGVELAPLESFIAGSDGVVEIDGDRLSISTVGIDSYASAYCPIAVEAGDRLLVKANRVIEESPSNYGLATTSLSNIDLLDLKTSQGDYAIYESTISGTIYLQLNVSGVEITNTYEGVTVQKLQPANMTLAVLVTMGVGSDEAPFNQPIIDLNNATNGPDDSILQLQSLQGSKGSDGVSKVFASLPSWDRGEKHLKKVDTRLDDPDNPGTGPQFRASYFRYTSDLVPISSSMVYGPWTTFDGSFDPLDFERWGFGIGIPMHIIWKATFDTGEIDEDTLLKLVTKYG